MDAQDSTPRCPQHVISIDVVQITKQDNTYECTRWILKSYKQMEQVMFNNSESRDSCTNNPKWICVLFSSKNILKKKVNVYDNIIAYVLRRRRPVLEGHSWQDLETNTGWFTPSFLVDLYRLSDLTM